MNKLLALLFAKALFLTLVIFYSPIGLSPDEAQYWTWSQELALGYYSKPPGIAWQIWITTSIFGSNDFGVRVGALFIGFLIPLGCYGTALRCGLKKETAFWSAVIAAFSPLGVYLSFFATTDGGSILFLIFAIFFVLKRFQENKAPSYYLVGLSVALGALFKWTTFFFWPLLFVALIFLKPLRTRKLIGGIALSLLGLLPSLYWNLSHDWATFRHVGGNMGGAISSGNFFDFFAAQIALITPIFFLLLILSYKPILKNGSLPLRFLALFPLAVVAYLALSLTKKMQPNWAGYLYFPAIALAAWYACEVNQKALHWLRLGTILSALAVALLFTMPQIQKRVALPFALNPFRQTLGGPKLTTLLTHCGFDPSHHFLFSDKYQNVSLLSFYNKKQQRAYQLNVLGARKNQFFYWPQMPEKEVGKDGFYLTLENVEKESLPFIEAAVVQRLAPYFQEINFLGAYPVYSIASEPVKYALVFRGISYNGTLPSTTHKY